MGLTNTKFRIHIPSKDAVKEIEKDSSIELKRHFQLIRKGLEQIPGIPEDAIYDAITLRALSIKPDIFKHWFLTEYHSIKVGEISSKIKEAIAYMISKINEEDVCQACAPYHRAAIQFEGGSSSYLSILDNYEEEKKELSDYDRTIIDFGIKLAFFPRHILDSDIQKLRDLGVTDSGIIEIISSSLIAYNLSAFNRILNLSEGQG